MESPSNLMNVPNRIHHFISWSLFLILLGLGLYLRSFGFFLPTNNGDQAMYQPLAMKMNHGWMQHYDIFNYYLEAGKVPGTVDYVWTEDEKKMSAVRTRKIYHQPLHIQPPLLPHLLWLSHGLFNRGLPYTSVSENLGRKVLQERPWLYFRAQAYAVLIPLLFSLALLVMVYLFCLRYFSYREGLIAVALLVTSPIDLAISQRIYADGIVTTLAFLALMLHLRCLDPAAKYPKLLAALSGMSLGFAYLTKVTAIVFASGFVFAQGWNPHSDKPWYRRFLDKRLWIAALAAFLVTAPWNWLIFKTYGSFHPPTPADPKNPWYQYVFGLPSYVYLTWIFYLIPPLLMGLVEGFLSFFGNGRNFPKKVLMATCIVFYLGLILFLKTGSAGVEARYSLPLYPLLAILSGCGIVRLVHLLRWRWARFSATAVVALGIAYFGWRAAQIGLSQVFAGLVTFYPIRIQQIFNLLFPS